MTPFGSNTKHVKGPPWMCMPPCMTAMLHSPASSGWKVALCTPLFSCTGQSNSRPVGDRATTLISLVLVPLELI